MGMIWLGLFFLMLALAAAARLSPRADACAVAGEAAEVQAVAAEPSVTRVLRSFTGGERSEGSAGLPLCARGDMRADEAPSHAASRRIAPRIGADGGGAIAPTALLAGQSKIRR